MKNLVFYAAIIIVAGVSLYSIGISRLNDQSNGKKPPQAGFSATSTEKILNLQLEIADSPEKRERGLSGRENLADNAGMLFVFTEDGYHRFWMKGMNFPLDIIWLDEKYRITHLESAVSPSSYPQTFTSPVPSRYVLEVPAGYAARHGLKTGDKISI